jgi:hypothetical protein
MKKQVRKLTLRKETLADLERGRGQVAGGTTDVTHCGTESCAPPYSACFFSNNQNTCLTCAGTCTTNLC